MAIFLRIEVMEDGWKKDADTQHIQDAQHTHTQV